MPIKVGLDTSFDDVVSMVEQSAGELNFNDALIALSCRNSRIRLLVSFDEEFDKVSWTTRVARPADLPVPSSR